jgi:hypothetical protein
MVLLEITTNAFELAGIVFASAFVGFILRSNQIIRSRARIFLLEREIRINHEEILDLQRDFVSLELKKNVVKDPGVKMKNVLNADNYDKMPDTSLRKKLLVKENASEKSETLSIVYNNLSNKEG